VSASYPPAPWHLEGTAALSTWGVAADRVPPLPRGVRAATTRGRALAVTVFVDYGEGGMMSYRELLAGVLVRRGRGVALSITDIWVDSEASLAGGRALWGIPKELAEFRGLSALDERGPLAFATFLPLRRLPTPRLPVPSLPSHVVQTRDGEVVASPIRASGTLRPAHADWTFPAANRLAWLRGSRRLASASVDGFSMTFG
jgi:hypothetical protein